MEYFLRSFFAPLELSGSRMLPLSFVLLAKVALFVVRLLKNHQQEQIPTNTRPRLLVI